MSTASVSPSFRLLTQAPLGAQAPEETGGQWWWAEDGDRRAWLHLQLEVGLSRPRFHFHLGRVVHAAPELGLYQVQPTLLLGHDATGEAELSAFGGDATLWPALMAHALHTVRAVRPEGTLLLVELPGWRDAQGHSPFWHGLVRHFAPLVGTGLVERLGPAFSSHLGPLLPRQPIHGALLSPETQAALGRPADAAQPLLQALRASGFSDWRHVRIDDGGPVWARPV